MVRIGIFGASGRMGKAIMEVIGEVDGAVLSAAIERVDHPDIGKRLDGNVEILPSPDGTEEKTDVYVDFTNPEATVEHVEFCVRKKKPIVVGTTGLSESQMDALKKASESIPLLYAPNMSYGVNVLFEVVRILTNFLRDYDIEIIEAHHRFKKDSPSGTALRLGEIIAQTLGGSLDSLEVYRGRGVIGERKRGCIGFSVVRGGDIVGEHTVLFAGSGECLEIKHTALSRKAFASGAVKAALWIKDKPEGFYSMKDVLGI